MTHAKSLRVIGQSLEVVRLRMFELKTDGPNYVLSSDSLSKTSEWILRHALSPNDSSEQTSLQSTGSRLVRFTPADILRLDDEAQKQRGFKSSGDTLVYRKLSQLLRTLGDHLDRTEASAFHIYWKSDSVSFDFQSLDGQRDFRTFTAEKLEQLGSHSRFRRSSGRRFYSDSADSVKQTRSRNR